VPRQRHTVDDLFQVLVRGRDIAPVVAKDQIEEALRLDKLQVDFRIRGGERSEKPLRAATDEELEQAKQAAKDGKPWSWDFLYSFTPPKGEIGPVHYDCWGRMFVLVIEDGKLVVALRCPLNYSWDAYSFTITNWPIVDVLWPTPARSANTVANDRPAEKRGDPGYDRAREHEHHDDDRLTKRRKRGSLTQDLVKAVAAELWPDGYEHVETKDLIKNVSDELKRRGKPVPKRDVFLRAFERRKG
jgi:hypothetical protein